MPRGRSGGADARNALSVLPFIAPPEGESEEFKREWYSIVEDYPAEHFKNSDLGTLESYVQTHSRLKLLRRQITYVLQLDGPARSQKINALMSQEISYTRMLLALARALRLTPSARRQESDGSTASPQRAKDADGARKRVGAAQGVSLN